ncbi:MAG: hypothetical protein JEY97_16210 [Bacteroidales bacterium]|nr:hypothetical protein [Bacteroidales bacterium]
MKTLHKNYLIVFCFVLFSLLSTNVNAQHFPFEGGGTGLIWQIYFQGITLDGIDLEAGDEMAIFDGDVIVGVFYLTQVCSPENVFDNALTACGPGALPPPANGYTPGNPVFYKCWDASEGFEGSVFTAEYFDPYGGAWTENIFPEGDGQYSMAEICFYSESNEQQIELSEGYSFISSRIMAENPDMQDILQNNLANLEFVRNSAGLMLRKIGPIWVNSIGDWVNTEGYLFKMSTADNLIITGDVIDPQTPLELSTGYQIIGYLPDEALNTVDIFQDILDNLEFVRNTAGLMLRKIGPNWVNSIGLMQPGEGYLVKMNADDILIYPASQSFTCGDPFIDLRDGQTYNSVQIGDQCWLAENLNIGEMINGNEEMTDNNVIEKYCYDNDPANCDEYGGLYQWNEIMQYTTTQGVQGICPSGWHLPTDDEWKILEGTVDSQYPVGDPIWDNMDWRGYDAGLNLKSTSGWNSDDNRIDEFGFIALACGYRSTNGNFTDIGNLTFFWASSEYYSYTGLYRELFFNHDDVYRGFYPWSYGFSVRCLTVDFMPVNQAPDQPSSPNPMDESENQSIEVDLSWTCTDPDGDPLTYDIYFGTETIPALLVSGQTETTYDPGILDYYTEYFWKIIAHDDHCNITEGPVWSFSTEGIPWSCGDPITDMRDEQIFNTVLIDNQCWLAENLNIGEMIIGTEEMTDNNVIEKYCYDNDPANCIEYGGLYQWNEMMEYTTTPELQGICPSGWHLPTDDEWKILEGTVDSQYPVGDPIWNNTGWRGFDVGLNIKSTSGWNSGGNGSGIYGFEALPSGYRDTDGSFSILTISALFWSSSESNSNHAQSRMLWYNQSDVFRGMENKSKGKSVRCLKE